MKRLCTTVQYYCAYSKLHRTKKHVHGEAFCAQAREADKRIALHLPNRDERDLDAN